LEKAHEDKPVRLTGVSMQELGTGGEPRQLGLFTEPEKPKRSDKLNAALDKIAERFGAKAVTTADIAGSDETEPEPERPRKPKRPN
jgi:DNA polymerase IV